MLRSEVLRIPAFRNLWLGQAISQLGDAFYYASFIFMVGYITRSPAMVGYVGAAEALPFLLFSPYAGVLADRMDRRVIMLLSDLLSAGALLALGLVLVIWGNPPVWVLFASAFTLSTIRSFFMPAKSAAIPAVVPAELVIKANSLSMTTQNVMPLIGLAFAASIMGVLFAASAKWFFFATVVVNAASFLGSAIFVAKMPAVVPRREEDHQAHPLADLRDGLRYIRSRHVLVVLLALSLLMNLMISPFFVVFVEANNTWFGGYPSTLGWLEFSFFLGMVLGSAIVGRANLRAVGLGYIWGLALVGLAVAGMAYSRNFIAFASWNVLCGIAIPFAQIPLSTFIQVTVPDGYRGRVNSALTMISMGAQPIGMSMGGILVEAVGIFYAFLSMGIGVALVSVAGLLDREFRQARLPDGEPEVDREAQVAEMAGQAH